MLYGGQNCKKIRRGTGEASAVASWEAQVLLIKESGLRTLLNAGV